MVNSEYKLILDFHDDMSQYQITAKQYDTARTLCINFRDHEEPVTFGPFTRAIMMIDRPGASTIVDECVIRFTTNSVIYKFNQRTAAFLGLNECEVRLYEDTEMITSARFTILVAQNVYADGEEHGEDHQELMHRDYPDQHPMKAITGLEEALEGKATHEEVNKKADQKDFEVLKARADVFSSLKEGSTSADAELMDLRVMWNGDTANTVGNAVRQQYGLLARSIESVRLRIAQVENALSNENVNLLASIMSEALYGTPQWDNIVALRNRLILQNLEDVDPTPDQSEYVAVTYSLNGVVSSNDQRAVSRGSTYTTTITPSAGFSYVRVIVTVGDHSEELGGRGHSSVTVTKTASDRMIITAVGISEFSMGDETFSARLYVMDADGEDVKQTKYEYTIWTSKEPMLKDTSVKLTFTNETSVTLNQTNVYAGGSSSKKTDAMYFPVYAQVDINASTLHTDGEGLTGSIAAGRTCVQRFIVPAGKYICIAWYRSHPEYRGYCKVEVDS